MAEKGTSTLLILQSEPGSVRIAQWSGAALLLLEEVGVRFKSRPGYFQFFFFHRFFTLWVFTVYSH